MIQRAIFLFYKYLPCRRKKFPKIQQPILTHINHLPTHLLSTRENRKGEISSKTTTFARNQNSKSTPPPSKFHIPRPSLSTNTIQLLSHIYPSTVHEHPTRASSTHKILTAPPSSCLRNADGGMMNSYTWPRVNSVAEGEDSTHPLSTVHHPPFAQESVPDRRIFTCRNRGYEGYACRGPARAIYTA